MRKMSSALPDTAVSAFTTGIWAMTSTPAQFKGKSNTRATPEVLHNFVKYI